VRGDEGLFFQQVIHSQSQLPPIDVDQFAYNQLLFGQRSQKMLVFLVFSQLIHRYPQPIHIKKWDNRFPPVESLAGKGFQLIFNWG
jgi:hypothetical protein